MENLKFSYTHALIDQHEIEQIRSQVESAHHTLHNKTGAGNDFTGWVDYPNSFNQEELRRIKRAAKQINADSEVLIVIGIGGSYLGARAIIEALSHSFYNLLPKQKRKAVSIIFAGNNISGTYLKELIEYIEEKDFSLNVISKSGTTTEPAIAFRILRKILEDKYGVEQAKERIYVTTDKEKGSLLKLAQREGYKSFIIPDDIGGRYSVLTPVGLLPIAAAGINVDLLLDGAKSGMEEYSSQNIQDNICYQYAALRNILNKKGKDIEILVNYEPSWHYFSEWWKQLFGESEGKDNKGIFPVSVDFSTDLHSLGQMIQDGKENKFETIIQIKELNNDVRIIDDPENNDGLNFISGKTLNYINKISFQGTLLAHKDGNVPNIIIEIPKLNEYYMGKLIYFFEKACAISGYLLGVNPFDQPGVEEYKKNMYALLGKPGYEELQVELDNKLQNE
jgi:glucose-6-phosphate isomerase